MVVMYETKPVPTNVLHMLPSRDFECTTHMNGAFDIWLR